MNLPAFTFDCLFISRKSSVLSKRAGVSPRQNSIRSVTRLNAETAELSIRGVFRVHRARVRSMTHGTSVYESLGDLNAIQLYPDNDTTILTIITYREEETFHGAREAKFKPYAHTEGQTDGQTDRQTGRQADRQTDGEKE